MSRKNYPTRLRDHLGNEIPLAPKPFAVGGEGAVFDVVGSPTLVAKLYSKPQSRERCEKLRAMASLCSPQLLKIAAWPTATLCNGNPAVIEGILMPRIADHKEIHHLYSVAQRKKDFPEADWGFLLHTARNCAIAFESVHGHGHVVGDVNQKNVMVSKKGIVALVDCDSFQVKEGNRIFRCGVGVPEYTPPELHGRKFTEVDRSANHDLFGLAVMIFHLLMMGRHPFAGIPQTSDDIPIEKAIQGGIYAYAIRPTKLKPPPHVPPLEMLDPATRALFERAFGSSQRPTATEWLGVLNASMSGLQRCKNDPRHSYPLTGNCPWCQLIAVSRLMFFIPGQGATGASLRIEDFANLLQKFANLQMVLPSYTRPTPLLPISITLPGGLKAIPKPELFRYPTPPEAVMKPSLAPSPFPPVLLPRPKPRPLPPYPEIPLPPELKPHPPAPISPPYVTLHPLPPKPAYPPLPLPDPPDSFLVRLFAAGALMGVPVYFVAAPIGMLTVIGFLAAWIFMIATERIRRDMAQESLERAHREVCSHIDAEYEWIVRPIEVENSKLLDAWQEKNAVEAMQYARICKSIDDENRRRLWPWEAAKAATEADHHRAIQEIEQANRRAILAWEAENAARHAAYEKSFRQVDLENQGLLAAWEALTSSRQMEHDRKCREIDAKNRQIIAAWEAAKTPWIAEQKRWSDRAKGCEAEVKRLEEEFIANRSETLRRFQQRKMDANGVLKSHDGVRQDYERDLRQAELDSRRIQWEEHLDKSLIRNAKIKGITGDRILFLESFGIETAKDVDILYTQKVPGIGPVLSRRLFDWRDQQALSFRPRKGLPESERNRIAVRYAPVLLPLQQSLQSAIDELEAIAASHRVREAEQIRTIASMVQDLAVAEAYVRAMNVV